jgi:sulfur carrier protein
MRLRVNGRDFDSSGTTSPLTVAQLVSQLSSARRGVAVAVNGEVVPRSTWAARSLADGDEVEVLTAAQGG